MILVYKQMDYHKYHKISEFVNPNLKSNKLENLLDYCRENQVLFKDKEFPPNNDSLIGNPQPADYNGQFDVIEWKRASELFNDDYDLFRGITPSDIRQGSLGNCYFLCSLASLAEYPDLIKRLFDFDTINDYGIQSVWLNINGVWQRIILDEYFPSYFNGARYDLAFSKTDQRELWVILLEKAYAKAYGSYWEIIGGDPVHALRDLTGAPYDRVEDWNDLDGSWAKIYEANGKNYMLTCFTYSTEVTEEQKEEGIVSGHAYTILDAREVVDSRKNPQRLLQIRNPWGKFEWNGDFSDDSDLWTPELKQELNVTRADDGIFWMKFEDFTQYFQGIGVLEIVPGYISNAVNVRSRGKKMLRMQIPSNTHLTLGIDQLDTRIVDNEEYSYSYFRLTIGRLNGNDGIDFVDSILSPERNIFIEKNYGPGDYIVLIEPYWSTSLVDNYNVSTYSDNDVGLELLGGNERTYSQAEYLIWKNFALKNEDKMQSKGTRTAGYGDESAEIETFSFQNKKFASVLYAYANRSNSNSVHQTLDFLNMTGFNVVGRNCSESSADLIINPRNNDVLLFKMDPRSKGFSLSHRISDEEVLPNEFSEDKTIYEFMNSLGGSQPTPANPDGEMSSRKERLRKIEEERQRKEQLMAQIAREKEERLRILQEKRRRMIEEKRIADELRREREAEYQRQYGERADDSYGKGMFGQFMQGLGGGGDPWGRQQQDPWGRQQQEDPWGRQQQDPWGRQQHQQEDPYNRGGYNNGYAHGHQRQEDKHHGGGGGGCVIF